MAGELLEIEVLQIQNVRQGALLGVADQSGWRHGSGATQRAHQFESRRVASPLLPRIRTADNRVLMGSLGGEQE